MEKSNLQKLKDEVLDHGAEAALPCNLSDKWLGLLERDIRMLLLEGGDDHSYMTAPLAIVCQILLGKHPNKGNRVTFTEEELFNYLKDLHEEITLEIIRRHDVIAPIPATLATIFTNRDISRVK